MGECINDLADIFRKSFARYDEQLDTIQSVGLVRAKRGEVPENQTDFRRFCRCHHTYPDHRDCVPFDLIWYRL
jgi:hypothetical protein